MEFSSLNGSYAGTLDKGAISGEWSQQGSKFPLVLTRYKKPEAGAFKPLLGEWVGKLKATETMVVTMVFRFENAKDGKVAGFFDSPDEGATGIALKDFSLEGNEVVFKLPIADAQFTGKLSNNTIAGTYKVVGREFPVTLTKGKYTAPPVEIAEDLMKDLSGLWKGQIGPATMIFHFERNATGKPAAFVEIPDQGGRKIPVTSATLLDGKLSLKVVGGAAEFNGKVSGNKIDGEWIQMGKSVPLSLTKQ
jgi:hypothetical protein